MSDDLGGLTPLDFRRKLRLETALRDTLEELGVDDAARSEEVFDGLVERLTDTAWDALHPRIGTEQS